MTFWGEIRRQVFFPGWPIYMVLELMFIVPALLGWKVGFWVLVYGLICAQRGMAMERNKRRQA